MTIQEALNKLLPREEVYSKIGKVLSVNETDKTCEVQPIDGGANILGVMICANQSGKIEIFPKLDSLAIVTFLGKNVAYLGLISEVDKIRITIEQQELLIDSTGVSIAGKLGVKSQTADLKSAVNELIDFILAIQVITPAGNGTLLPALVPQLNILKSKFNSFLM